jgi:hypothetical protein
MDAHKCARAIILLHTGYSIKHWILEHWILGHWILEHWILGHWILEHWILGHWILGQWILSQRFLISEILGASLGQLIQSRSIGLVCLNSCYV